MAGKAPASCGRGANAGELHAGFGDIGGAGGFRAWRKRGRAWSAQRLRRGGARGALWLVLGRIAR